MEQLKKYISEIYDFPQKGIIFKDLNPIYKNPELWKELMLPIEKLLTSSEFEIFSSQSLQLIKNAKQSVDFREYFDNYSNQFISKKGFL